MVGNVFPVSRESSKGHIHPPHEAKDVMAFCMKKHLKVNFVSSSIINR
jgi:hypothetical protein